MNLAPETVLVIVGPWIACVLQIRLRLSPQGKNPGEECRLGLGFGFTSRLPKLGESVCATRIPTLHSSPRRHDESHKRRSLEDRLVFGVASRNDVHPRMKSGYKLNSIRSVTSTGRFEKIKTVE